MRRRYNNTNRNKNQADNFWPSFADVMSTVALVLLFLVMIVFVKNIIISINLEDEKTQLNATQSELENKIIILDETKEELKNERELQILLEESIF